MLVIPASCQVASSRDPAMCSNKLRSSSGPRRLDPAGRLPVRPRWVCPIGGIPGQQVNVDRVGQRLVHDHVELADRLGAEPVASGARDPNAEESTMRSNNATAAEAFHGSVGSPRNDAKIRRDAGYNPCSD